MGVGLLVIYRERRQSYMQCPQGRASLRRCAWKIGNQPAVRAPANLTERFGVVLRAKLGQLSSRCHTGAPGFFCHTRTSCVVIAQIISLWEADGHLPRAGPLDGRFILAAERTAA